jgi:two-component system, OmpR family, sensor histidine kinase QseC
MRSIRIRLFAIIALCSALAWGAAAVWIQVRAASEIQQVLDRRLMESAQMVSSLLQAGQLTAADAPERVQGMAASRYERQLSCQIWSLRGELVSRSDGAPSQRLTDAPDGFSERMVDGERWRTYSVSNPQAGVQVLVGDKLHMRDRLVQSIVIGLVGPALLGLVALAFLIWWSVDRGLAPVRALTGALIRRDVDDPEPLPTPTAVRELEPFVAALNSLIDRLAAARSREAAFTAAAAHELRTPLAGLRLQAQVAASSRDDERRRHALDQIIASVDRTSTLVTQLLELARQESEPTVQPLRREASLEELVREFAEDDHRLSFTGAALGVRLQVDPDRIGALLGNVLTNARQYADAVIMVDFDPERLILCFEDDGPGVPDADLERIGQPFHRGRQASPGGSGLGLSIADAAASAHGWRLSYARADSGGLKVEVMVQAGDLSRSVDPSDPAAH